MYFIMGSTPDKYIIKTIPTENSIEIVTKMMTRKLLNYNNLLLCTPQRTPHRTPQRSTIYAIVYSTTYSTSYSTAEYGICKSGVRKVGGVFFRTAKSLFPYCGPEYSPYSGPEYGRLIRERTADRSTQKN